MSECDFMRESMPLLLTESLDPVRREQAHSHIERCPTCGEEWNGCRESWRMLGELPEVEVPPAVKERFLASIGEEAPAATVVSFWRRTSVRWMARAAAVVVLVGGSYYAGHRGAPLQLEPTPATINSVAPAVRYSIAESRVIPATAVSPTIEGRPNIHNISFIDTNPSDDDI